MAVTQQLARISGDQLELCRQSVHELHRLCSYEMVDDSDQLDLDWAPAGLRKAAEHAQLDQSSIDALNRAFDGDFEVNPNYKDHPRSVMMWGTSVTAVNQAAVVEIARILGGMDPEQILAALPKDTTEAVSLVWSAPDAMTIHPAHYLQPYFTELIAFYQQAVARRLAVVQWWD